MIIDCHGHYTTAPAELEAWRKRQIAAIGDPTGARTATLEECVGADVIVIATPWPQYAELAAAAIARSVIIDCWRILPPTAAGAARKYICLGTEAPFGR